MRCSETLCKRMHYSSGLPVCAPGTSISSHKLVVACRPYNAILAWYRSAHTLAALPQDRKQPHFCSSDDDHLAVAAVHAEDRPHLNCHIFTTAAGIDCGVVVHVVPGARREVRLCGHRALVHNGRYQQRITCAMEASPSQTLTTETIVDCMMGIGTLPAPEGSLIMQGTMDSQPFLHA